LFQRAAFETRATFIDAIFEQRASFITASFEDATVFLRATFKDVAEFTGITFNGIVSFSGSRFRIVPDLRATDFKKHVTLHGIEVNFRRPAQYGDADMYRRLKELAVNARDHDREQMFFAYELIAKRGHETHGLKLIPNYLYEWTSDFGRSLRRPSGWLLGVWFGFGVLYGWVASKDMSHLWDGLLFSTAQIFPFLGASRGALGDARNALYGEEPLSVGINALAFLEGGLGILFLFLIGLVLRNRFRI